MGFEIEDAVSVYQIGFGPDSLYHGLEVEVSGMTIGEYNEMMRGFMASVRGKTDEEKAEAGMASSEYIRAKFFEHIRKWNLTQKGKSVPVSQEVMDSLDSRLATVLVRNWMDQLTAVPEDLVGKSPDGEISPDQSTALAKLSSSLTS